MTDQDIPRPGGEIVLYQTEDGRTRVECRFENETLWLSQALLAELFQVSIPTVNEHLKGIYAERELEPDRTIRKFRIVRLEGARQVTREIEHYSLEAILAVGYRVRSPRGTAFRQWATTRLQEYLVKGFVMDDERLKNPPGPGVPDYFDELLERIRDIRSSEKRMYLKVCDIFALAADYQPNSPDTQQFFQIIQNKMHWAATGKTAAELIAGRADHMKPNMGLTSWKGAKVRKLAVRTSGSCLRALPLSNISDSLVPLIWGGLLARGSGSVQQLHCFRCCFDCYRTERTSSQMGTFTHCGPTPFHGARESQANQHVSVSRPAEFLVSVLTAAFFAHHSTGQNGE